MRRFDVIFIFLAFSLSTSVFFQNCSEMKATGPELNSSNNADPIQPIPEFLTNRNIPLDNKIYSGTTNFSVGGSDVFTYETSYIATYETTLVTIRGEAGQPVLEVLSDDCTGQKNLTTQDVNDFIGFFSDSYVNAQQNVPQSGDTPQANCSLPRLLMNATGTNGDVEIYYTSKNCTPTNELYLTPGGSVDPTVVTSLVQAYFQGHINEVCGL